MLVWVVNDKTENYSKSLTSFKQAIYFVDELGLKLYDTMIFKKANPLPAGKNKRYSQCFDYMFVFSKGKPKTFNPLTRKTKCFPRIRNKCFNRSADGGKKISKARKDLQEYTNIGNIWEFKVGYGHSTKDKYAFKHPAIFPEALAEQHIYTWSNRDDIILDCFMGSGTTGKAAINLGRRFIGIEKNEDYFNIANKRIAKAMHDVRLDNILEGLDEKSDI